MADENKAEEAKRKSRELAKKELDRRRGFPVPPRKAMSEAKKANKGLLYPLPPYANPNPISMFLWARQEWDSLGRWKTFALPFIILTALLTWEKEKAMQEDYYYLLDRQELKEDFRALYVTDEEKQSRRKLFGLIPLPGGRR